MAQTVIAEMGQLARSQNQPPKCLVVMNSRHAFDLTGRLPQARRENTYEFLRDAFDGRAANVVLGAYNLLVPVAGGVWDSAFAEAGDPLTGFDFAGSPFGEDAFDMLPFVLTVKGTLKYRDVFTGFVYAQPLDKQYFQWGVPGQYTGYEEEAVRLLQLADGDSRGSRRWVESIIKKEKAGLVPFKEAMPGYLAESWIEICLLALTGMGLLIGVVSFGLGLWRYRSRRDA
jgi:hypothetical protein